MAQVFPFDGVTPRLGRDVWLAPTATVIGHATLGDESSVWFGTVIRADLLAIVLGARTNVQDNAVIHITGDRPLEGPADEGGKPVGTRIGDDVTIGHGAIVHACTIGDRVLVGMGAIILDGAVIGNDVVIAAGSLVSPGTVVPDGTMVMGSPAKVRGPLRADYLAWPKRSAEHYVAHARRYARQG